MQASFRSVMWIVAVVVASLGSAASAQSVATFNGGSGSTETAQTGWTTGSNWSPIQSTGGPSGTNVWALMNSQSFATLRIAYSSLPTTRVLSVGAISFQPTMTSTAANVEFRNSSTSTTGTTRFYGIDTTIDGTSRRIILDNQSSLGIGVSSGTTSPGGTLFAQEYELFTSGAINVAASATLTLAPLIRDGGGTARSITKIGRGVLSFASVSFGSIDGNSSTNSTYSGGFILDGGIVQWASSGTASVGTPFGLGPLTLRSGTLRSTNTSGKSINTSVVLDGAVTLGSTDPSYTGSITINSSGGSLSTTVASASTLTIVEGGSTNWNQATSGVGSLTKAGAGILRFSGAGGALTHTGSTAVQSGTMIMAANLSSASAVSVLNAATLLGTGTIAGATSILAGGVFSPGATSGTTGVFTFGAGGLSLAGQTVMDLQGSARGTQYDGIDLGSSLGYGGSLLLQVSGSLTDGTYELFKSFTSQAGSFSSVALSGFYTASLTEAPAGVWTGVSGGQTFTFTNTTGNLVIVPEPAVSLLGCLGAVAVATRFRSRGGRRHRRLEDARHGTGIA